MEAYDTLSEAVNALVREGYTYNFNIKFDHIHAPESHFMLKADDFVIDKMFRFEGFTDPADNCIVYAISSPKYNIKGTLVNAYGIYSDPLSDELVEKLNINRREVNT